MSPAALILSARSRGWRAAWQRLVVARLDEPRVTVQCESLTECSQQIQQWPQSWVAVEVRAETLGEVLPWVAQVERDFPGAAVGALLDADVRRWTFALREAGAVHCCGTIPDLTDVAHRIRRHVRRVASSGGHQDPLTELIAAATLWPSDGRELPETFDAE